MIDELQIYSMLEETESLGPGKRFAIWLQGCDKHCDGCLSPRSQPINGGKKYKISELVKKISEITNIEGLTISGGEPFLQAEGVSELIFKLKKIKNYGFIIYSGYDYEYLKSNNDFFIKKLLLNVDLLIDGMYIKNLDDGKSLRGSSNQRIISLTSRYENHLNMYGVKGRKVEMFFDNDKIYFSGVPSESFLKEWNNK